MTKRKYAALKQWMAGELSFEDAFRNSAILRRIVYRILTNEGRPDDEALGVAAIYPPYSTMNLMRKLEQEGLITLKSVPLNAGTTKIVARPTDRLKRLINETGL